MDFNYIPANLRVPLVYIEFDPSQATNTADAEYLILVLGQMLATGTATLLEPIRVTSAAQAKALFGEGSMLAAMFAAIKDADDMMETWALPMEDDAAGQAAAGSLAITGPATAAGTLSVYIAGTRVRVAVASGDTAAAVATALAAAINAETTLPVTAAVNGEVDTQVDLTCRWKGETGNAIDVRTNYYQGEALPAGIGLTVTALSGGTANPDLADAIAAFGDEWWRAIVNPYTDAANMTLLEAELDTRWGPTRQIDGIAYCAFRGTHGETGAYGESRNSHLVSCLATGPAPQPPYLWAAVYGVTAAASLARDPARPLQTLVLPGIMPASLAERWTMPERNLLLHDGIATHTVGADGLVRIEAELTMHQVNDYGDQDDSYLYVTTPATLSYRRWAQRQRLTSRFPRHKLADDGSRFGPGQSIVTPKIIRAELLALFREHETAGLVENFDAYAAGLVVERDADNPNRVNVLEPPDIVNQFRIFAMRTQFRV